MDSMVSQVKCGNNIIYTQFITEFLKLFHLHFLYNVYIYIYIATEFQAWSQEQGMKNTVFKFVLIGTWNITRKVSLSPVFTEFFKSMLCLSTGIL